MSNLFLRKISMIVGSKSTDFRNITDLRMTFEIEKTEEPNPNTAKFSIYNLSSKTRSFCEQKDSLIQCSAGYDDNIKTLFTGDIALIYTIKQNTDEITNIEAGDGETVYQTKNIEQTFEAGTSYGNILDALIKQFGLKKGIVKGFDTNKKTENGITLSGMVKDILTELTKSQDLNWSIQNGVVQILAKDAPINNTAILLSPQTGLIGKPYKQTILKPELIKADVNKQDGLNLISLLIPTIEIGSLIKLDTQDIKGNYRVRRFKHNGDNWSKNFYTTIEAFSV